MSCITVRGLIDSLNEMVDKGEISEGDRVVDALLFENDVEEYLKTLGFTTPRGYYHMDEDAHIPDGALFLRIRSKDDGEYDTYVSFYMTKEEAAAV